MMELAYASAKYDRISRIMMTETAARFWIKRVASWSDVMRAIIRSPGGEILEDISVDHRITDDDQRARCERVASEAGPLTAYTHWRGR